MGQTGQPCGSAQSGVSALELDRPPGRLALARHVGAGGGDLELLPALQLLLDRDRQLRLAAGERRPDLGDAPLALLDRAAQVARPVDGEREGEALALDRAEL